MNQLALATLPVSAASSVAADRRGAVPRPRLVGRLVEAAGVPIVSIVAPAGYGKTSTLLEWSEHDDRDLEWIALGGDEDGQLLTTIARSLDGSEPDVTPRLAPTLQRRRPSVLVLDNMHLLPPGEAADAVASIARRVPAGSQLVLASRTQPSLPIGRMRAHRRVVELSPQDLAMTRPEAALLMRLTGLELSDEQVATLVARTEGWPAALYLAAHSMLDQPDIGAAVERFSGHDRIVSDYLREELLSQLPRALVQFLVRTSILKDLSGPLCDAVLARQGSADALQKLARAHIPLVPLDRSDARYRYHRLFAEMLRGELHRLEPENEAKLHRAAAAWYEAHGDVERALWHATSAGDRQRAGALLWSIAPHQVFQGRDATINRWLDRFTHEQVATHAPLALTKATTQVVAGRGDWVDHWASAAANDAAAEPSVNVLRAVVGGEGMVRAREDATRAYECHPETSPGAPSAAW